MNMAFQKKADELLVQEKPTSASLSMMQRRGRSIRPYEPQFHQDHQSRHRKNVIPSMQQNRSMKVENSYAFFPVARNMDLTDWKPLIIQFQHARSTYLPDLFQLHKRVQEKCIQRQNVPNEMEYLIKASRIVHAIIKFLRFHEGVLTIRFSKQQVYHLLHKIAEFFSYRSMEKSTISGGSQVLKPSTVPICRNNGPITPSVQTTLIRNSIRSSFPQPSSRNSPICGDVHAKKQADKETLVRQGSKGTAYNNAHHNAKINPRISQSSSENQPLNVVQSRKRKKVPEKEIASRNSIVLALPSISAKLPQSLSAETVQKNNTFLSSDPRATSPTSVLLSFGSQEIEKPAKQPLERLIQAMCLSKEALMSSIDDMASVVMAMDKLPEYANDVRSANLPQGICCSTCYECTPHKHMKHDIESVRSNVSTLDNSDCCSKRARNKLDHCLMDEIRDINQRLIETVIKVDSDPDPDPDQDSSNAIMIKCTYKPIMAGDVNLARHVASIASQTTFSTKFLVPSDYPSSPPKVFNQLPVGCCKEGIDWMEKINSRFDLRVRGLTSPGLVEMAKAWDDSARSVYSDFVFSLGGGSFTCNSKYGTWKCVPAT